MNMDKKRKEEKQPGQHPGAIVPKDSEKEQTASETPRRQEEVQRRNEDQQQKNGDRFPRGSYEKF